MKPKEIKKVLIALDYDQSAQKVAEAGYALAKNLNADVVLIHVISDPANYTSTGHVTVMGFAGYADTELFQIDSVDGLKVAARSFLDKSKLHLGDKNIETVVGEGDYADTILKTAKSQHADLIVMGSHNKRWLEKIVLGSVTSRVFKEKVVPMFIVPTKKHE